MDITLFDVLGSGCSGLDGDRTNEF